MRLLLAFLAMLGLLMTPMAASAGAAYCAGHMAAIEGGKVTGMAAQAAPVAAHTEHKADHSCCDPDGAPTKHDKSACAKACAAMCVAPVALNDAPSLAVAPLGRPDVETTPLKVFQAHAPPGLERPPKHIA